MSVASAQYHQFIQQVKKNRMVYTFTEDEQYLLFKIADHEVIPFWSSQSHLNKIQEVHGKYQSHHISVLDLERFIDWLPTLAKENIHIGINWSGKKLIGYDLPATEVLRKLNSDE